MFVDAISNGDNGGKRIRQLNRSQGRTNFKVDLLENRVPDEKMLYQISFLFFDVESPSPLPGRLYYEFQPTLYNPNDLRYNILEKWKYQSNYSVTTSSNQSPTSSNNVLDSCRGWFTSPGQRVLMTNP